MKLVFPSFRSLAVLVGVAVLCGGVVSAAVAQEKFPRQHGQQIFGNYHPNQSGYRESESHPLRVVGYVLHPIGWVLREVIFRPISYIASSTPETRDVFGYREPSSGFSPSCFNSDVPDCRVTVPFNAMRAGVDDSTDPSFGGSGAEGSLAPGSTAFTFPNVNFDFNTRTLNEAGKAKAKEVAAALEGQPAVTVLLEGHADYIGSEKYNERLGLDRAQAVKAELVSLGVSAERLNTVSFGESKPLLNEKTAYARSINRRVEVRVK